MHTCSVRLMIFIQSMFDIMSNTRLWVLCLGLVMHLSVDKALTKTVILRLRWSFNIRAAGAAISGSFCVFRCYLILQTPMVVVLKNISIPEAVEIAG